MQQRLTHTLSLWMSLDGTGVRIALAFFLAAILLYTPLVVWGLPSAVDGGRVKTFAPDEIVPLEALAEMHSTFVVSKSDRNYGYPWLHYFLAAGAQAPYLAFLYLTDGLSRPDAAYPYGLRDAVGSVRALAIAGRLLSVVMSAGVVVGAFYFGCLLWGRGVGVVTAGLTLLSYPLSYYSHTGNLDAALLLWCTLGLVVFATVLNDRLTVSRAVVLGVLAALATATKDQGVLLFAPLGFCLLFRPINGCREGDAYPVRALLTGFLASLATYVAATGMLVDPDRHIKHVTYLLFERDRIASPLVYANSHVVGTWTGFISLLGDGLAALSDVLSPIELALVVVGSAITFRKRPETIVFILPLVVIFFVLSLPVGAVVRRYLLPAVVPLTSFAAVAVVELYRRKPIALAVGLGFLVFGWKVAVSADLAYRATYEPRYQATAWFAEHTRPGDGIEYFASPESTPNVPPDVVARPVAGITFQNGDMALAPRLFSYLRKRGPRFLVLVPDWTSRPGMETSFDCPPAIYAALKDGSLGYRPAAYFPAPRLLPASFPAPRLDSQAVAPPVRIFERKIR